MGCWGHPRRWRVESGEDRFYRVGDPTNAEGLAPGSGRQKDRFVGSVAGFGSASPLVAYCRSGAVDERHQVGRGRDRYGLVLGSDSQRARRTVLFGVGQPDHCTSEMGRGRSSGHHGHVVAAVVGSLMVGIDHGDVSRRRVEKTAEDGGEQPAFTVIKNLAGRLR